MFKRVTWFVVGAASGSVATVAAARKVKSKVDQVVPPSVRDGVGRTGRAVRTRISDAVSEGRTVTRQRDAELRQRYSNGHGTSPN